MAELAKSEKAEQQDRETHGDSSQNHDAENLRRRAKAREMPVRRRGARRGNRGGKENARRGGDGAERLAGDARAATNGKQQADAKQRSPIDEKHARLADLEKLREEIAAASTSSATWALQKARLENHSGMFMATSVLQTSLDLRKAHFVSSIMRRIALQIFFTNVARFDEMDEQRLGGAVEHAIDKFADHAADDLVLRCAGR